jgi:hypothetical protein
MLRFGSMFKSKKQGKKNAMEINVTPRLTTTLE